MKFGATDFRKIQLSLLAALLMCGLGAAAILLSLARTKTAEAAKMSASKERNELEGKLKQVRNEENEIKQKSSQFSQLQARGVIGEERRLDWVELLKDIRNKRHLLDLQYEISPQRALDTSSGGFTFYASAMKLQVKLLHEEDLTRLLDDLRTQAKALIQVKRCDVTRLPRGNDDAGAGNGLASAKGTSPQGDLLRGTFGAQLQADCLIDWVTLRETAGK